jgi:predicted transcriptional regulator of viral defense system
MASARNKLLQLTSTTGQLTAQAATNAGIHSQTLTRLVADGTLERVSPGRYRLANEEVSEHHAIALATAAAPNAVVCLLSALAFHEIGTQLPAEVWLAVARGSRPPKVARLALQILTFSEPAFSEGIEVHRIDRQEIRVYSVAKTIADLFKARRRVGVDVAVEAMREAWRDRRCTMADLDRAARVCRVERVMRPYLEAITA